MLVSHVTQYLGHVVLGRRDDHCHVFGGLQVCDCTPVLLHRTQTLPSLGGGGGGGGASHVIVM